MPEFLLEIGVEEMPASWLPGLTEQMRQRFTELAQASLLDLCAIWAIFRAIWAARPVYQADTKCWASRDEPVEV